MEFCRQTFFSLWSYSQPQGKKSKELCDILVICEPDVIIISVKEIEFKDRGNYNLNVERWQREAIEKSSKQLYGAERRIEQTTHVIMKNGKTGLPFPEASKMRIHRIAVALGGKEKVPIYFGDFGKGFIHVLDEKSFFILIRELNTIEDFVDYLIDKEKLYRNGMRTHIPGSEEDLLALYLYNNRKFPCTQDEINIRDGLWSAFIDKEQYKAKLEADGDSYGWDNLIDLLCEDCFEDFEDNYNFLWPIGGTLTEVEKVVRIMARENRFNRRILGKHFKEFLNMSDKIRSRACPSPSGIMYVFLATRHGESRDSRMNELSLRCFCIRGSYPEYKTLIGVATEKYIKGKGFSLDTGYYHFPTLTSEDMENIKEMRKELGFFDNPRERMIHEDEYPTNEKEKR